MSFLHSVRIAADALLVTLDDIQSFHVTNDMLELADDFEFSMPFDIDLWRAVQTDTELSIYIDEQRVMNGFVDRRKKDTDRSGSMITTTGRDRGGRLVDESAPLLDFVGKGLKELGEDLAGDWFDSVSLSNARNRRLIGGGGKALAGVANEPAIFSPKDISKKVEPGDSRAQVIQEFLEKAGLLAWSSADGKEFIIGKPNYGQEVQYNFLLGAQGSLISEYTNVLSSTYTEDIGEVYAEYLVCGSSRGNGPNYGKNVTKRRGSALDVPDVDGIGGLFQRRKRLIISDDDIRSTKQAQERAERELALRFVSAIEFEVTVPNWGQRHKGQGEPVLYAFDKIASYVDEEADIDVQVIITRVQFAETKQSGQVATISMVPIGTELVFS